MVPAAFVVHPGFPLRSILMAAALPVLALGLYVLALNLGRLPRERPWDGRLRAACVAASALLLTPLFLPFPTWP